ncbi:uncharacterized protein LOC143016724 [Genypterus blacodes]|uniref:uncharacterized protein LOC143016724 n=1 Tax=Genypterus blacodes TaxID=154954 RepID=UPI003F773193
MMGVNPQHTVLLFIINTFILTTEGLVTLHVSPVITAECGGQITLTCNASSDRGGLLIKHLGWIKNDKRLCDVNGHGNITEHRSHTPSNFRCEYEHGKLSLIFASVQPVEVGLFMCKLHSNHGMKHQHTKVDLQGCCGKKGPNCTFTEVYPDADVHWFLGSKNITGGSPESNTAKNMGENGWITVHSYLLKGDPKEPYNCSLWCPTSAKYITSDLLTVRNTEAVKSGTTAQRAGKTFWFISVLLAVMMK